MPDTPSMIELVSKAIEVALLADGAYAYNPMSLETGDLGVDGPVNPANIARAVLTAMREPTEEMHDAGMAVTSNQSMAHDQPLPTLRNSYRAMIDAALEDGR